LSASGSDGFNHTVQAFKLLKAIMII